MITKYSARYLSGKTEQGINHRLEYRNQTERRIEAVEVGNDLDSLGSRKTGDGSWIHDPSAAFLFYTGAAYISRVRFEDGDIWTANLDDVARHIGEIDQSFSADLLRRKDR